MYGIQVLLPDGENSTNTHVAREEIGISDVNIIVRGDKIVPKESNFFNKLRVIIGILLYNIIIIM